MELLHQNFIPYMAYHLANSVRIFIDPGKAELDLFTGRLTYGHLYNKKPEGFFTIWKNRGMSGMGNYVRANPSMPFVILILLFNIFRLAGIILFFLNRNVNWLVRTFTFVLLAYCAVAAGPIANTRYFLPVSLIAIGSSALGWTGLMQKRRTAH